MPSRVEYAAHEPSHTTLLSITTLLQVGELEKAESVVADVIAQLMASGALPLESSSGSKDSEDEAPGGGGGV
jgi:hypothetical protein